MQNTSKNTEKDFTQEQKESQNPSPEHLQKVLEDLLN
jgi:hypothetical protein